MTYAKWSAATAILAIAACMSFAAPAIAATDADKSSDSFELSSARHSNPALLAQAPSNETTAVERKEVETVEAAPEPFPLKFGAAYYLYSDYVWRAKNLSEYATEGREKLNHQMTTTISWTTKDFGTFGFNTFFEWYADQEKLNRFAGDDNLQEVDYNFWWAYQIKPIATELKLAYTYDIFPNASRLLNSDAEPGNNNDDRTSYYDIQLTHNDAWMWKWLFPNNEAGVLNPYFLFSQDVGAMPGVWMELGISHPFKIPGIDNLTITPAYKMFGDCSYWSDGCKIAGDQVSLVTAYDLTPLLHLPKWAGKIVITGDLYFNNALGTAESNGSLSDEFWGGMSVQWNWGG